MSSFARPLTVATALVTSFFVAMVLTPLLARFFIRKGLHNAETAEQGNKHRSPLELLQVIYNRVIVLAMRRKPIALAAGVLAAIGGALTLEHIPQRFFPLARSSGDRASAASSTLREA